MYGNVATCVVDNTCRKSCFQTHAAQVMHVCMSVFVCLIMANICE
jgi:hypothetical protein